MIEKPDSICVCSLSKLGQTVRDSGASHILTLINAGTPVERPSHIAEDRHLFLGFNDITTPMEGMTPPGAEHVEALIGFAEGWDRQAPMVVHCWAGISRSTAGAFISICALNPSRDEMELAQTIRRLAPSATPNARLVAIADNVLGREGRMVDAVLSIGRGEFAYEGTPFALTLD